MAKKATFNEVRKAPELVDADMTHCPRCGSTRRAAYRGSRNVQRYAGVRNGQEFTKIIRRRTSCLDCGLPRIDRHYCCEK